MILAVLPTHGAAAQVGPGGSANCAQTSVGLTPLMDLGQGTYQGYEGGLYPGGSNRPPVAHLELGLARARMVRPLALDGRPDPHGRIVLLAIGLSNASTEFSAFQHILPRGINPHLLLVNGAQDGQDAETVANPSSAFWSVVEER